MKNISHISLLVSFALSFHGVYAATCTLDTIPSPAVNSYKDNIDTILEAIKKEGSKASCSEGSMSSGNTKRVLDIMQGSKYDIGNFFRSTPFFLDTSDKMLLPSAKKHDDFILEIQQKIIETGAEIGGKCAGDIIRFKEDISLKNSRYKTKNRTLQEVLNNVYAQNGEVLSLYRELASNVQSNEYLNEDKFTVAPTGFSDKMRDFYSPSNIQQCHDEDAKKQKIQKTQKEGLAEAMKYPQSVNVWKKAFDFLLYGKSAQPESLKETTPTETVHAKTGGLGNSIALLNKGFQKIFGFLGNSQGGPAESVREAGKRNSSGVGLVPSSFSEVTHSLTEEFDGSGSPTLALETYDRARGLNKVTNTSLEGQEQNLTALTEPNAQENNRITAPLVNALEEFSEANKTTENNAKLACESYGKQSQNYPGKEDCEKIMAS